MSVSLDTIKEEINQLYKPFVVEDVPGGDVTLLPLMRLAGEQRDKLVEKLDEVQNIQDQGEKINTNEAFKLLSIFSELVDIVAEDEKAAKRLKDAVGDDPAMYSAIFNAYSRESQVGEASPSED